MLRQNCGEKLKEGAALCGCGMASGSAQQSVAGQHDAHLDICSKCKYPLLKNN